jgi:hypothetical protein
MAGNEKLKTVLSDMLGSKAAEAEKRHETNVLL